MSNTMEAVSETVLVTPPSEREQPVKVRTEDSTTNGSLDNTSSMLHAAPSAPQMEPDALSKAASTETREHDCDTSSLLLQPPPPVVYQVEYLLEESAEIVHKTDAEEKSATSSGTATSVLEAVDVNMTWSKEIPKGAKVPPTQRKGIPYIKVISQVVIDALRYVAEYYPGESLSGEYIKIYEPYAIVWHHEDALEEYRRKFAPGSAFEDEASSTCANRHAYEHIGVLLSFVRSKNGEAVAEERMRHADGFRSSRMLWLLYKPGIDIYIERSPGLYHPYILKSTSFEKGYRLDNNYWIDHWNLQGRDGQLGCVTQTRFALYIDGVYPISTARVIPCGYLESHDDVKVMGKTGKELRKYFEDRGKRYYGLKKKGCFNFDGNTTTTPVQSYAGQVMVDESQWEADRSDYPWAEGGGESDDEHLSKASTELPVCSCVRCKKVYEGAPKQSRFGKYIGRAYDVVLEELTPHEYFLCEGSCEAFLFKTRVWAKLDVMGFRDPEFDRSIIKEIVLAKETKSLITRLTEKYVRSLVARSKEERKVRAGELQARKEKVEAPVSTPWTADFVKGKGEGLIFLLHGKPGVGKTYTAECIAAHTERPLLSLTCADIGTDPDKVEAKLQRWFKIATNWGAIMLIDEADIYMEHRQVRDLKRNNLVAGFLRALEYYRGILFLTTNRVGTFDEAFISRIHVMLHYPPFDNTNREEVWENFFRKLEEDQEDEQVQMKILDSTRAYVKSEEVQGLEWNGREIRNAFQIAVALAQSEDDRDKKGRVQIKRDHIKSTVTMSKNFKTYLKDLFKKNETQRAAMMGNRLDSFLQDETEKGSSYV